MTGRERSGQVPSAGTVQRALRDPERSPLASVLDTELEEAAVPEFWRHIDARLVLSRSSRVPRALGVALMALAAFVVVLLRGPWLHHAEGEGALAFAGGRAPTALSAGERDVSFGFADGSRVDVSPFTELHVVRNDGHDFVTALVRGRSTFDVRPGGPRRWVVEAGRTTVEVIGTRFAVRREEAVVRVDVERGIVLVHSRTLAGGSTRLTAGQSVVITQPDAASSALPATVASLAPVLEPSASPGLGASAAPGVRLAGPEVSAGVDASPDAVDRALAAADAARRRGDRIEAATALEVALAAARSGDKRRGLAALSLARLVLTSDPKRAASVLRESFAAMPAGLVEDALARRVEAEGRAGDFAEASRLATEYRRRFPEGQRLREVMRWSGD